MNASGTVTFLFTDLVGSTELLARLGDDAALRVHRQVDGLLAHSIAANQGRQVKNLGDGLMVVFPGAFDAVRAALDMQARLAESRLDVAVRIGINSGEATTHDDDDYYGTPVVVAERLCSAAEGGEILVSGVVRALIGSKGGYSFAPRGAQRLKGFTDPIEVWSVGATRDLPATTVTSQPMGLPFPDPLAQLLDRPLVGRDEVLAHLSALWEVVADGQRRTVLIAGEPGIGKSATAAAWSNLIWESGGAVTAGRCAPEAVIAYQPFVEVLRHLLSDPGIVNLVSGLGSQAAELARLVPDLAPSLPKRQAVEAEPGTERYLLYEAVAATLHRVARQRPLVVVLDDLHWADTTSIGLLDHLVRHPDQSPLLILGTYRETDLSRTHPLAASLAELRRERRFERIHLSGLGADAVAQLVSNRTGTEVPPVVAAAIWEETEGNPFFVEEVVEHLIDRGVAGPGIPWPSADDLHSLEIPEGIRELVGRRLSRLSAETNRTLAIAAVIGREFDTDLLQALHGPNSDVVFDHIDEAVVARILVEAPSVFGRYAFSHALIRQTLYEELNPTRRSRMHRQVADVLVERKSSPAELALHFTAAHDPRRALIASIAAAEEAEKIVAVAEAARHYRHALELWEEVEDPQAAIGWDRSEVLRRAAEVTYLLDGGLSRAIDLTVEAEQGIDPVVEPIRAGVIAAALGNYLQLGGRGPEAIAAVERSIFLIPADPLSPERARALATLAGLLMLFSRNRESEERCWEAIECARLVGDESAEAHALVTLGTVEGSTGRVDDGVAHILMGRKISESKNAVNDTLRSYANLSSILDVAGRFEEAVIDALAGSDQAARWHVYGKHYWFPRCNAAWSLIHLGRWEEAAAILASGEAVTEGVSEVFVHNLAALLAVLSGRADDARRHLDRVFSKSTGILDPQFQGPIHWVAALNAWFEGRSVDAWEIVETGLDLIEKGEDWFYRAPLHAVGVAVQADLALSGDEPSRRRSAAGVLVRALRAAAVESTAADFPAQLAQAEAELTRAEGAPDPAAWEQAADLWAALRQPYEAAYCRFRQGEAALASGQVETGASLLAGAAEVANRMGALPLARMIKGVQPNAAKAQV